MNNDINDVDYNVNGVHYGVNSNMNNRANNINNKLDNNHVEPNLQNYTEIPKNQWIHFAICRSNGTTNIFKNGVSMISTPITDTYDYNSTIDLIIGNESIPANNTAFGGYIYYFSWVKGTARYTSDFTVSVTDYPPVTNTQVLLLKASDFEGTLGSTVVNNNVSTTPNVPVVNTPVENTITLGPEHFKSMFTDNAMVYYKPNSLASCGVGTVRNSTIKARKT
jgi:hypothetical protein